MIGLGRFVRAAMGGKEGQRRLETGKHKWWRLAGVMTV